MRQPLVACVALVFVLSVVAVPVVGSPATGVDDSDLTDQPFDPAPERLGQSDEEAGESVLSECAVEPPEDHADPAEDVLGWSNGYWYDEPLEINQTGGLDEEELDALIGRTKARVEAIRCLEFEAETDVEVVSREQFQEESAQWELPEEDRRFDNVVYEAMLLVDEDDDIDEVQRANLDVGVGGYYDPASERIVVIAEDDADVQFDETILAHELGHALQDQHFNLTQFDAATIDESKAQEGIIEGDVHYVEQLYEEACEEGVWEGTCQEVPDPPAPPTQEDLENVGLYLLTFQPYSDGPAFVDQQYRDGGWDAIDDLYENPPETTEEIIHPEVYPNYEPTDVSVSDNSTDQWERLTLEGRSEYEVVGQAGLFTMFSYPTIASNRNQLVELDSLDAQEDPFTVYDYSHEYTDGWEGDRLHPYENDDGETGYVWTTEWETEADAETFREGYDQLLGYWGAERVDNQAGTYESDDEFAGAYYIERNETQVSIVHAPSVEQLRELDPEAADEREWSLPQSTSNDSEERPLPGFGVLPGLVAVLALCAILAAARRR